MEAVATKTLGDTQEAQNLPFTMYFASVPAPDNGESLDELKYDPQQQVNSNSVTIMAGSQCWKKSKTTDYWKTSPFQRDSDDDMQKDD